MSTTLPVERMARSVSAAPIQSTIDAAFYGSCVVANSSAGELEISPRRKPSTRQTSSLALESLVSSVVQAARTHFITTNSMTPQNESQRAKSMSRLFNTSEEVFRAWESILQVNQPMPRKKSSTMEFDRWNLRQAQQYKTNGDDAPGGCSTSFRDSPRLKAYQHSSSTSSLKFSKFEGQQFARRNSRSLTVIPRYCNNQSGVKKLSLANRPNRLTSSSDHRSTMPRVSQFFSNSEERENRNRGSVRYSASPAPRSSAQGTPTTGNLRTTAPISVDNLEWLDDRNDAGGYDPHQQLRRAGSQKNAITKPQRPSATTSSSVNLSSDGEVLLTQGEMGGCLDAALDKSIKEVNIDDVYTVYKQLGTGRFGYVKLAEHKSAGKTIALKFFPRAQIRQADFLREYNCSRFLSPHPNIIDTFEGIFHSVNDRAFFFVQEFCPCASLREAVELSNGGIGEQATKMIMQKVFAAIEFMHGEGLVHRNIKAENILIFDKVNYTRVKVTDFGLTRKVNSTVKHLEYVTVYHAPELCETVVREAVTVARSIDIWALGIMLFYALKGRFPWPKATIMCKQYWEWDQWLKHKLPQLPKQYDGFHEKALKLFKRCLNPKSKDRWSIKDLKKFIEKDRLLKTKPNVSIVTESSSARQKLSCSEDPSYRRSDRQISPKLKDKSTAIQKLINTTFNTMAEISEQVVSATDR